SPPSPAVPPPPQPPTPPAPPKLPANVKSINIENGHAVITLKNGKKEQYDLNKQDEKAAYEKKYGKVLEVPEPPELGEIIEVVPPSVLYQVPAVTITGQSPAVVTTTDAVTVKSKNSSTTTTLAPVQATIALSPVTTTLSNLQPVRVLTDELVLTPVASAVNVNTSMSGERIFELKVYKTATRQKLDQYIADAKVKGIELSFSKLEYNSKNELISIAGVMKKGNSTSTFNTTDFETVTLIVFKDNDRYSAVVIVKDQKEEM
ncbi:MAG: hypothetical protein ABI480_17660, partial [Chitinophagaceae bacterium]